MNLAIVLQNDQHLKPTNVKTFVGSTQFFWRTKSAESSNPNGKRCSVWEIPEDSPSARWILKLLTTSSAHLDLIIKLSSRETNWISAGIGALAVNDALRSFGESSSNICQTSWKNSSHSPWFKRYEAHLVCLMLHKIFLNKNDNTYVWMNETFGFKLITGCFEADIFWVILTFGIFPIIKVLRCDVLWSTQGASDELWVFSVRVGWKCKGSSVRSAKCSAEGSRVFGSSFLVAFCERVKHSLTQTPVFTLSLSRTYFIETFKVLVWICRDCSFCSKF